MVAVIETVFQLQPRMARFAGDHAGNIVKVPARRFFAEYMQPAFQPRDRDFRRDIVRQADEQGVQVFFQQVAIVAVKSDAVVEHAIAVECSVADSDGLQSGVKVDEMPPPFADNAVPGDSDAQALGHRISM